MGTGAFGGGGGGGSGMMSSRGGYRFENGQLTGDEQAQGAIQAEMKQIFNRLSREYLLQYFASSMFRAIYEELFILSVQVFQNQSWQSITEACGIDDGPGCLQKWVELQIRRFEEREPNQKVRDTARACLEDFVFQALGNNIDLYIEGTGPQIIENLQQEVFNNTSGHFLSFLVWRVLEREKERLPEQTESQWHECAQVIAERVTRSYERKYYAREQRTWRQLFEVIAGQEDWLLQEVRK